MTMGTGTLAEVMPCVVGRHPAAGTATTALGGGRGIAGAADGPSLIIGRVAVITAPKCIIGFYAGGRLEVSTAADTLGWPITAVMTKNFLDRFKNDKSGLCLGGFYLGRDLLQESSGRPYAHGHARWSGVYGLEVMIYDANGGAVAMNISGTSEGSDRKKRGALVILRMPLWSSPPPPGHQLQCASWSSAVGWTADKCRTAKQTTVRGRQAIECKCPLYAKYFSVFARPPLSKDTKPGGGGPGTSGGETTSSTGPPKLDYTYTADFVIEADFQKTVRPVKQEFESSAKSQLNKQFKLPKFSTVGTSPLAGKTLVEVTMWGGPGELSGQALTGGTSDVSGAIGRLARALATGTLVIEVPGGKETVRVPQQTLRVTQRIQGEWSRTFLGISSIPQIIQTSAPG
ncbi:hypothetical protein AAG570_005839 [Ranatra chinensis]|uniref:Uncharacterized protein n=1 Tax=Ranatra chinensis TaxID=642074 RepID=A0ABD0YGY8_9HEMI